MNYVKKFTNSYQKRIKKNKMKDKIKLWLSYILILLFSLIVLGIFFIPVIISLLTGNWWFMLLFIVTWIPTWGVIITTSLILSFLDNSI